MEKKSLPNSVVVLILGICSIIFGCFFVGLILSIISLSLSSKGRRLYHADPNQYEGYGMLNAGYILSIIGLVLSSLYIIYWIIAVVIFGGAALSLFNLYH
jgi:hypothetical protein